jgi:hypothetical protein
MTNDTALASVAPPRIGRLDTLRAVRLEVTRLYKECRRGELPTSEATKLCYLLKTISELLIDDDQEKRLAALEKAVHGTPQPDTEEAVIVDSVPETHRET